MQEIYLKYFSLFSTVIKYSNLPWFSRYAYAIYRKLQSFVQVRKVRFSRFYSLMLSGRHKSGRLKTLTFQCCSCAQASLLENFIVFMQQQSLCGPTIITCVKLQRCFIFVVFKPKKHSSLWEVSSVELYIHSISKRRKPRECVTVMCFIFYKVRNDIFISLS